MSSEAVKREAQRGKKMLEDYSRALFQQQLDWRDGRKREVLAGMFTSTQPGGRGATSPLGGQSPDWEWSGRKS
jgi:hypothetical protein